MIHFRCPVCRAALEAPDDKGGTKVPCSRCGQRLLIPPPIRNKTILAESLPGDPPSPSPSPNVPVGACPACKTPVSVPPEQVGRWVECPDCGTGFVGMAEGPPIDFSPSLHPESVVSQGKGPDEKFCHECGAVIRTQAQVCPKCGVQQLGVRNSDYPPLPPGVQPHRGMVNQDPWWKGSIIDPDALYRLQRRTAWVTCCTIGGLFLALIILACAGALCTGFLTRKHREEKPVPNHNKESSKLLGPMVGLVVLVSNG
jgi:DNA-directed RNA polymerase subunit RPC12/RpoP